MAVPTASSLLNSPSHSMLHASEHNVKAYGAVGNGVADDTAEIQAAIDAADQGGHVFFPPGDYIVSSTLTLNGTAKNIRISGTHGRHSEGALGSTGPGTRIGGSINGPIFQRTAAVDNAVPIVIEDMAVYNSHASGTVFDLNGVSAPGGIFRCHVRGYKGIVWGEDCFCPVVFNCDITWTDTPTVAGSVGVDMFDHCQMLVTDIHGYEYGVKARGVGLTIIGMRIEVCDVGVYLHTGFAGVLSGSYFEACDTAILVGGIGSTSIAGVTVYGTIGSPSGGSVYGIDILEPHGVEVGPMRETGTHTGGFVRVQASGSRENLTFNTVSGSTAWDIADYHDIRILNCSPEPDFLPLENASAASGLGAVVGANEVFDTSGNSLGYIPIYDTFTAPNSPDDIANLVAWYDFSQIGTVWQDTARTSAITADGQTIKGVTDLSGVGNHLSEATNGPTYKTAILSGDSVARFDGTNDLLACANDPGGAVYTAIAVVDYPNTAAATKYWYSPGAGIAHGWAGFTAERESIYSGAALTTTTDADTNFHIYMAVVNGASSIIYRDGVGVVSGNAGSNNPTQIQLAAHGANFAAIDIGEVAIYNAALASTDLNVIGEYFEAKWGITWTTI